MYGKMTCIGKVYVLYLLTRTHNIYYLICEFRRFLAVCYSIVQYIREVRYVEYLEVFIDSDWLQCCIFTFHVSIWCHISKPQLGIFNILISYSFKCINPSFPPILQGPLQSPVVKCATSYLKHINVGRCVIVYVSDIHYLKIWSHRSCSDTVSTLMPASWSIVNSTMHVIICDHCTWSLSQCSILFSSMWNNKCLNIIHPISCKFNVTINTITTKITPNNTYEEFRWKQYNDW